MFMGKSFIKLFCFSYDLLISHIILYYNTILSQKTNKLNVMEFIDFLKKSAI